MKCPRCYSSVKQKTAQLAVCFNCALIVENTIKKRLELQPASNYHNPQNSD